MANLGEMHHILVTNDFPPKVGGIQTYLWELWRRLPADSFTVVAPSYPGDTSWDAAQPFRVERTGGRFLSPGPRLASRVDDLIAETGAALVLLDPVAHTAPLAAQLGVPYGVIVHGAEIPVQDAIPFWQLLIRRSLRGAAFVVAAGSYPAGEAARAAGCALRTLVVPPGVDCDRFRPLTLLERADARARFGVDGDGPLVVSLSRLVPRKGMHLLVQAAAALADRHPGLRVLIAGDGRERGRLEQLIASTGAPVRLVGRVADADVPAFYGMADVFAMLSHDRFGGLEQEGFGIVFLEAAACGVPVVAGASGGVAEAVEHGTTGFVIEDATDRDAVVAALDALLADPAQRVAMGGAGRRRAVESFDQDALAHTLHLGLAAGLAHAADGADD
jgi:phosphatidyl-myo-inositol dimannoside synthase